MELPIHLENCVAFVRIYFCSEKITVQVGLLLNQREHGNMQGALPACQSSWGGPEICRQKVDSDIMGKEDVTFQLGVGRRLAFVSNYKEMSHLVMDSLEGQGGVTLLLPRDLPLIITEIRYCHIW